jgi:phosphatidylglycerol:prolipoprotein diacylglycerol transferase
MHPELFKIGDFPINTYGVLLAIGILTGLLVAARLGERDGIKRDRIFDLGLWSIIGGLLGSKLLMLAVEPGVNPFSLDFLRSGGVFYGGLIGGFVAFLVTVRIHGLPIWKTADALAPGVALGQAFGREGCFAAGCCWGKVTTESFGVHFSEQAHNFTGVPIYQNGTTDPLYLIPVQLYESLAMFVVFGVLLVLHRRRRFDGQILAFYGLTYGVVRFGMEFLRDDPRGDLFGLTTLTGLSTAQMISVAVVVAAAIFISIRIKHRKVAA